MLSKLITQEQRRALISRLDTAEKRQEVARLVHHKRIPEEQIQMLRRLAQTDLFFLARYIIGNEWITERTHNAICDFFVQKDPDKTVAEQEEIKERLLLYPRGSLKSTLNIIDTVQWVICFPDIVIIILTAADELATDFVDELKSYFICETDDKGQWSNPTLFQALFPEFLVSTKAKDKGVLGRFTTPARRRYQKEPTVLATSIGANNSGKHCHVLKLDDAISDANSETAGEQRKLTRKIAMVGNLLMAYGYLDMVGTRYGLDDAYGKKLQTHGVTKLYGGITVPNQFKYLCYPAWWVKGTDYRLPDKAQVFDPDCLELLFPEVLTYKHLLKKYRDNIETFCSQQLNDPVGADAVIFLREDLINATVSPTVLPREGRYFIAWDWAYGTKRKNDYTVGAVGLFDDQQRIWIVDVIRGKYKAHELPYVIVKAIKDYRPVAVGIEGSLGAEFLRESVNREGYAQQVDTSIIDYFPVSRSGDAKLERVKSLEPFIASGKLKFSTGIDCLEALYHEFERFTGDHTSHDDIPDAIAYLLRFLPRTVPVNNHEAQAELVRDLMEKDMHDRVYRQGVYAPVEPELPEPAYQHFDPLTGLPA